MPKSKRAKVVHLSKVTKKGRELSERLFANVRESAENNQYCFVFGVDNMRNNYLKDVRAQFSDSRIFFGKTKVMAKALGQTPEEECLPNISKLSKYLNGLVGLFFTNQTPEIILPFFEAYSQTSYARSGIIASRTFEVPEGVVYSRGGDIEAEQDVPLAHSIEPLIRGYGMPTRLIKGKIMLDSPYEICKEGKELNSHQTALLKTFGAATAEFKIQIKAYYSSATEDITEVEVSDV